MTPVTWCLSLTGVKLAVCGIDMTWSGPGPDIYRTSLVASGVRVVGVEACCTETVNHPRMPLGVVDRVGTCRRLMGEGGCSVERR